MYTTGTSILLSKLRLLSRNRYQLKKKKRAIDNYSVKFSTVSKNRHAIIYVISAILAKQQSKFERRKIAYSVSYSPDLFCYIVETSKVRSPLKFFLHF